MRADESKYWDARAMQVFKDGALRDNVWKRERIMRRLMDDCWWEQRVLEIGVGAGTSAAALTITSMHPGAYIGTDVSPEFCKHAQERWGLKVINTDVLDLPVCKDLEGKAIGFTRIICLDSLEHVNPEDRAQGYMNIGDALAEHGRIYINMPLSETKHDLRYDHPFTLDDIQMLLVASGTYLKLFERYSVDIPPGPVTRHYGWVVLER